MKSLTIGQVARRAGVVRRSIRCNCVRFGPRSQNHDDHPAFREHLLGRIAWFAAVNPQRGARLRRLFEQIDWGTER